MLRSDFLAGQGFTKLQIWQTLSNTAGGAGVALGDPSGAMWNMRLDTGGSLHFDRFASGAWYPNAFTLDKTTGRVTMGGNLSGLREIDTLAVGVLDGQTGSCVSARKGGKAIRMYSDDSLQLIDAYDWVADTALPIRMQTNGALVSLGGNLSIGTTSNLGAKLYIVGGDFNSGIHIVSSASGAGISLENNASGGHRYSVFAAGAAALPGAGGFALRDDTLGKYRMMVDAAGRWQFGHDLSAAPTSGYLLDIVSGSSDVGRFRQSTSSGVAVWEIAQGDGTTSSKSAQLNFRSLIASGPSGWDTGMVAGGMTQAGDYLISRRSGGTVTSVLGIDSVGLNLGLVLGGATPSFAGGQGTVFVANRTVAPTTNPTGGFVMYAEGGAAKVRGASGTVTTFGPADPHCPACGADFTTEHFNPRYGYVSICLFCLAAELGDRPFIVRHQTAAHRELAQQIRPASISAERASRLAAAMASCG
jgi:hypothetical protein